MLFNYQKMIMYSRLTIQFLIFLIKSHLFTDPGLSILPLYPSFSDLQRTLGQSLGERMEESLLSIPSTQGVLKVIRTSTAKEER